MSAGPSARIFTLGHSTRPIGEFIDLLQSHGVRTLVDIRRFPHSRHNPQYERDALAASLVEAGIAYRHCPGLGGRRRPLPESMNKGWRNEAFRGFADYMQSAEFAAALDEVVRLSADGPVALMCSEGAPFRCHRSLVADALVVRGVVPEEISGARSVRPHRLTPFARIADGQLTYPSAAFPSGAASV